MHTSQRKEQSLSAPLERGPSLPELIDQHSAAVQGGKKATARRLAIINYKPKGEGEANLKLTYLAAYLIATKARFPPRK